ncbi:MAG: hypothetical protein HYU99_08710, partial [Deltaproteobacteria bacterium]|nr:hypothetical protein [Deltaproteobacteria bacterium]
NACSSSQTNVSAQTGADGAFTATAPAGTYTVAVWPPYDRRDIASVSTEVTLTSNTTQVVTLEMPVKNATISGRLVDANGAAVTGWINGWHRQNSAGSSDWFSAQADNDGYYTAYAVDGLVYNLTANANTWGDAEDSTICTYTTEGAQTVEASAAADQTVNFTFPLCDCPMQVNLTNEDGDILTQLYAGAQASPESSGDTAEGGAAFRGNWASLNGGTGTMQVEEGVELSYDAWFWDEDYIPGDPVTATCSGDGGVVNLVAETVIEDAVSGGYVDAAGSAITLDGYTWLSVYASRGRQHRPCNVTSSGYSCDLSAGSWKLGHWINPESGYASGVGSSSLVVSDSGGLSEDLTLLRVGSIDVTVTNTDGSPRGDVFVQANPYSGSEEGGFSGYFYSPDACYTGSDGICTIKVGAAPVGTTYYLTAHIPFSMQTEENIFNPEEVAVTVTEGGTTAAALSFVEPDGSFDVVVTEGTPAPEAESVSPVANATVDCFALEGFNFSEGVDDESGLVGCPCMTGIVWYAVAYGMVGSNLYMSAVTETECAADSTTSIQLALDYVVTVPESQSATISDISSQTLTLTMEDGFKVVFPQTSLGSAGQATCTADAAVTPFTSNKRPVSFYGYTVACFDGNGVAITDLDADATFVLPYNATQVANLELEEDQLESNYFDTSAGAYSFITTAAVDTEGDSVTFTQDHLTDFALLGNGVLAGANGEDGTSGTDDGGDDGSAAEGGSGCGCWMGDDFSGAPRNGSAGRRSSAVPLVLMVLIGIAYVRRRRRI